MKVDVYKMMGVPFGQHPQGIQRFFASGTKDLTKYVHYVNRFNILLLTLDAKRSVGLVGKASNNTMAFESPHQRCATNH